MPEYRDKAFVFQELLESFNEVKGYYDLKNYDLERALRGCKSIVKPVELTDNKKPLAVARGFAYQRLYKLNQYH